MNYDDNQVTWQPGFTLLQMELMVIGSAYRYYKGNKSQAAKALDINIKTFDAKLAEIEVQKEKEQAAEDERRKQRELFEQRARGVANSPQLNWSDAPFAQATNTGLSPQSSTEVPAQQSLSMPKLEEVQKVLPRQTAGSSQRRGR